jgi:hypothetical protein
MTGRTVESPSAVGTLASATNPKTPKILTVEMRTQRKIKKAPAAGASGRNLGPENRG